MPSASWLNGWLTGDVVLASELSKSSGSFFDSTLGASAASFDITGVPTWGSHLRVALYLRGDAVATGIIVSLRLNNDSGTNYSTEIFTAASTTLAGAETLGATSCRIGRAAAASAPANSFSTVMVDLPHFRGSTNHKTAISASSSREGTTTGTMVYESDASVWFGTPAAVTRLTIFPASGNFVAGSRCTAYVLGP